VPIDYLILNLEGRIVRMPPRTQGAHSRIDGQNCARRPMVDITIEYCVV
jgi:hypothetical protein